MELKRHYDWKYVFIGLCAVAFLAYIIYGLQPAGAVQSYEINGNLSIPGIDLTADVADLHLTDGELKTPDTIVGSYSRSENKTLLIGHSTTVFQDLDQVKIGDVVSYNGKEYKVNRLQYIIKEAIDMSELLAAEDEDTLVIMTCAGKLLDGGDATHRFIVTAVGE